MIDGLPIAKKAFERTVRLVSSARMRPPVLDGLVPPEMMDALHELEGATSGRLNGQWRGTPGMDRDEYVYGVPHAAFINASFAYPKPGQLNRFNSDNRGAWYAALDVRTCLEEVRFHISQELEHIGEYRTRIEYAEMHASFAGDFLDLTVANDHECLHPDPDVGYPAGNAVAEAARARGLSLIIYPSIRHEGGTCVAALSPHAVQSVEQGDVWEMVWNGTPDPAVRQVEQAAA